MPVSDHRGGEGRARPRAERRAARLRSEPVWAKWNALRARFVAPFERVWRDARPDACDALEAVAGEGFDLGLPSRVPRPAPRAAVVERLTAFVPGPPPDTARAEAAAALDFLIAQGVVAAEADLVALVDSPPEVAALGPPPGPEAPAA